MDLSLWDAPIYEDESSDFGGNWQPDFYFYYGRDVMEEDAINEKCCIQVLNILIPKADTDIEELEQEIILLEGELAWTDEVWSKIRATTLTERIGVLDMLIKRLKNEKLTTEHELDFHFQTHGEPALKLSDTISTLLDNYTTNRDKQNEVITITDLITNSSKHVNDVSTKRKMDEVSSSLEMGQGAGIHDLTAEAEKRMYTSQIEKEANAVLINTSTNASRYEAGSKSGKWGSNHVEEICGKDVVQSFKTESVLKPSPKPKETTISEADMA